MLVSGGRAATQARWLLEVLAEGRRPTPDEVAERLSAGLLTTRSSSDWCEVLVTVGRSLDRAHIRIVEVDHDYLVRLVLATLDGPLVRFSCRTELATGRVSSFGLGRPFRAITWTDERIPVSGGDLRVRDYGGSGHPFVLLHCGLADVSHWDRAARELPGRRLAIDLRAHGQWGADVSFRVSDIAGDIVAALRHVDLGQATLVGHSLGGSVALTCAARYAVARRLVTLDGPFALGRPGDAGPPSPPDAPEWQAVEHATEPFGTPEHIDVVEVPWLAVLCDARDNKRPFRAPLAERIAAREGRRVVWEPTTHEALIDSPRALHAAGQFGSLDTN